MKNIPSTFGIVLAAGLTIGAISAVSIAEGQMYTKGGVIQNAQTQVSTAAVTANAGSVTTVNVVEQPTNAQATGPAAVALGPAAAPANNSVRPAAPQGIPANGQCAGGRQALSFDSPTVSFRGVTYSFTPTPPITITGGAAIAAIYPAGNGQSEICYSGECISGPAGSCGAIAFAQPGGRVRLYVQ